MPSPVGHALAGVAAGLLIAGGRVSAVAVQSTGWASIRNALSHRHVALFGLLGVAADADFLFGVHSSYTHSVGATVVVAAVGCVLGTRRGVRFAGAVAAAYGSHSLLDWLGSDAVAPIGVMALWPLSSDFFLSDRYWFMSVCREYWLTTCWWHNTEGVVREVLLLGPVLLAAVYFTGATVRR